MFRAPRRPVQSMTAKKQRRIRRGLVLSEAGFARVNRARRRIELDRNGGARISLEQLAFEVGLSAKTLSRLFGRDVPVDRRTLELLFAELGLTLEAGDVGAPAAHVPPDRSELPRYRTVLFGRADELARLDELARERMVVTLTGSGGVGKTRLAVEWMQRTDAAYSHVAFLDLSLLTDGKTLQEGVRTALGDAAAHEDDVLIVLDGCEHLIEAAAATVNELLDTMPRLSVLATSREPLGIAGEAVLRLAPLAIPSAAPGLRAAVALRSPAFAMFVERARSFDDGFTLGEESVATVAEIVRRLEGVPLALELAAARGTSMSLADLLASLRNHLDALTEGPRAGVPRHRSARALIDWSFALLTPQERDVFERLAAFMGSFDAAAVAAACGGAWTAQSVADVLAGLVRKSLVLVDTSGAVARFRLLETIRQYAAVKLAESGDAGSVRQRHALYYYGVAVNAANAYGTERQDAVLRDLQLEIPNLREALEWSSGASRNVYLAAALTAQLVEFWEARGELVEAEHWLRTSLRTESELLALHNRAKLHEGLALVTYRRGGLAESKDEAASALGDYALLDDVTGKLRARNLLGLAALDAGEVVSARDQFEANLSEGREANDQRAISAALSNLGRLFAQHEGRFDAAMPLFVESLRAARESGSLSQVLTALTDLSDGALGLGQHVAGLTYARLGVAEAQKLGNREATADLALQAVAHQLRADGVAAAHDDAFFAWGAIANIPFRPAIAQRLDDAGFALHAAGEPRRAAVLLGATDAFRRRGEALSSVLADERRRATRAQIATLLAPGEGEALYTRGASLSLQEAYYEALLDEG